MKIYYLLNSNTDTISQLKFTGLVSMDIGFRTYGITIINPKGEFKTFDIEPIKTKENLAKMSIPDYIILSKRVCNVLDAVIRLHPELTNYMWSMEIPNIIGSFAPALSMLISGICNMLELKGIPAIFFTGNRLGGYFLKKRSYTKTEIKKLVKENFKIDKKISDHEADSVLQAYSIYLGIFKKRLLNVQLRDFEVELERLHV